ncbi:ParB/RepB/Spo0J family partition protein [Desulfomicrobium salsuginis]
MGNYKCGKLYNLALSGLTPNPDQPRKLFSEVEIEKLAESIKEKGLLQPILVKELEDGQIIIVSGERRFKAHERLKLESIPAWFTTGDPEELALVENLVREDLTAIETAEALKRLQEKFEGKSQKVLAKLLGKTESTVSEILSLNKIPIEIRDEIRHDKRYAIRELKTIANKKTEEDQRILFQKYKDRIKDRYSSGHSLKQNTVKDDTYHRQKLTKIIEYFKSMREPYKLAILRPLDNELHEAKNSLEELIHDFNVMTKNFDASKTVIHKRRAPKDSQSTDTDGQANGHQ